MSVQTTSTRRTGSYLERPAPSSLADVIEIILDKGMVIDAYVRVSLVGIELLTIDARIVIASVDTYLRFAEATNRLDLGSAEGKDLGDALDDLRQGGAKKKTKGAIEGVKDALSPGSSKDKDDDDEEERPRRRPQKRSSSSSSSRSRSSSR